MTAATLADKSGRDAMRLMGAGMLIVFWASAMLLAVEVANKSLAACYRAIGSVYRGTGSDEPFQYLVDILSLPKQQGHDVYRRAAASSLMDVEFSESSASIAPRR